MNSGFIGRRHLARLSAALILVAQLLLGCAVPLQKPEVSVSGVELLGFGLVEQRVLLKLRIANPNDVDLTIKSLDFALEVNGEPLARGAAKHPLRVARQAEAQLDVAAQTRLGDLLRQLRAVRQSGAAQLPYRLYGHVDLEGYGMLPFDRSGELPLAFLERFAPK